MTKTFSILAAFLSVSFSVAQQPQGPTPGAPATPPVQPRSSRQPQPDRAYELQALTPEFWKLFDKNAKLQTMGTGFAFTEGPVWDPAGFLWLSDEKGNKIDKLYPDGHVETMVSVVDPDGSTFDKQHRLWSTSSGARAVILLSPDGRSFEIVVDHYQGKLLNTPNDIVTGPDGAIYFTDPIIDMKPPQQEELPESIYRIGANNALTLMTSEIGRPNGLAFSPNGNYLYIDSDAKRNIRRYRFHKDGTISDGMDFGDLIDKDPTHRGAPDGMKLDKHGYLFVCGPNGFWVWNSKGVHIGSVQMPHSMANLTWGGAGYSKLYITAGDTVYILQTKTHGFLGYLKK
jgi:gluconolactonase